MNHPTCPTCRRKIRPHVTLDPAGYCVWLACKCRRHVRLSGPFERYAQALKARNR